MDGGDRALHAEPQDLPGADVERLIPARVGIADVPHQRVDVIGAGGGAVQRVGGAAAGVDLEVVGGFSARVGRGHVRPAGLGGVAAVGDDVVGAVEGCPIS